MNTTKPSTEQILSIRTSLPVIASLVTENYQDLLFADARFFDFEDAWTFSPVQTDRDLWRNLKQAAKVSVADVNRLLDCSSYFISKIQNATEQDISKLLLYSVSCFRCALSDSEIANMLDMAASADVELEKNRNPGCDAFIVCYWRAVEMLLSHDRIACKAFMNLSDDACKRLSSACTSSRTMYNFVRMAGHRFSLACESDLLLHALKTNSTVENIKSKKPIVATENILKAFMRLQQSGQIPSPEKLSKILNEQKQSRVDPYVPEIQKEYVLAYLSAGICDEHIMETLGVTQDVVDFFKRKLQREQKRIKDNSDCPENKFRVQSIKQTVDGVDRDGFKRLEYFQDILGQFWAFLGLSKSQIKILLGVSDAKSKRYRVTSKRFGFVSKHETPKNTSLEWKILKAIFIVFYIRIGGPEKVMIHVDPQIAHEAYLCLLRGLSSDLTKGFKPYLTAFDNFFELAKDVRQAHISLEYCHVCNCYYVKQYNEETGAYEGECHFCTYRDTYVTPLYRL